MKKKVLLITMCLTMVFVCLCGCSSNTGKDAAKNAAIKNQSYNNQLYDDVFVYMINYVGKEVDLRDMVYSDFGYTVTDDRAVSGAVFFSDPELIDNEYYVAVGYDGGCVEHVMLVDSKKGDSVCYSYEDETGDCECLILKVNGGYKVDSISDLTSFVQQNMAYPVN